MASYNGNRSNSEPSTNSRSNGVVNPGRGSGGPVNQKAEQFEDEKRRIMATCFAKRDEAGKLVQSYITHVRVDEDAAFQQTPPPPGSNPTFRKPRVIILAVKSSGRVSMHKARENEDGSFQIGKTWGLEELRSIESFSNSLPKTPEQQQLADWAGATGFIIHITKPYYWAANSPKEKEFFIGSLVKIYNKFTGGRFPELIGFDQRDKDAIFASCARSRAGGQPPPGQRPPPSQQPQTPSVASPIAPGTGPDLTSLGTPDGGSSGSALPPFAPPERPYAADERRPSSSNSSSWSSRPREPSSNYPSTSSRTEGPYGGPRLGQQPQPPGASSQRYPSPADVRNGAPPQLRPRSSRDQGLSQGSYSRSPAPSTGSRLTSESSRPSLQETPQPPSTTSSATPVPTPRRPSSPSNSSYPNGGVPAPSSTTTQERRPSGVSSSTADRWKPAAGEADRSTPDPYRTAPESANNSWRDRQAGDGTLPNGVKVPERRRPPLKDTVYGDSARSTRNDASRPRTPADGFLQPGAPNDRPITPATPQAPGAFTPASSTPGTTPSFLSGASPTKRDGLTPGESGVSPAPIPDTTQEESFRPGLGPMMGKKIALADKMRKAANVHRAFVPRAGGAGERLAKAKETGDSDRITDVIPARSAARDSKKTVVEANVDESEEAEKPLAPAPLSIPQARNSDESRERGEEKQPSDTNGEPRASSRGADRPRSGPEMPRPLALRKQSVSPTKRPKVVEKPKRRSNPFMGAFANLGLDPSIAQDDRAVSFESQLTELGWGRGFLQKQKVEAMQTSIRREVRKIEAGSWLGHSDQRDPRVDDFEKALDKAIDAVDEMDGLLTLYSVELSTLVDDVTYIEAQSQGLQVQTANQKLLQNELENLVHTVSIDTRQLEPLRTASLDDLRSLEAVEGCLSVLYRALQKIDPDSFRRNDPAQITGSAPGQTMRALQDRKAHYMEETDAFLVRFRKQVDPAFEQAFSKAKGAMRRSSVSSRNTTSAHDTGRAELWAYSPLMLLVKEVSLPTWKDLLKMYRDRARTVYQEEIFDSIAEWKRRARKITAEDQDLLFTSQKEEVESTGLSAARKMTIKRSGTLARSLRQATQKERSVSTLKSQDANQLPYEIFAGVLADSVPTISSEQNFVTDFFHASGLESFDFVDAVLAERPADRRGTDLYARRMHDPDRAMADIVRQTIESMFAGWAIHTQALLEWALGEHQLQGIGILYTLERLRIDLTDTNQEYLLKVLDQQFSWLLSKFKPFIDAQIAAIESTKIKTTKRRGVMHFTRIFTPFVSTVEAMLQPSSEGHSTTSTPNPNHNFDNTSLNPNTNGNPAPETRATINEAYTRLTTSIFKTLDSIARDSQTSHTQHSNSASAFQSLSLSTTSGAGGGGGGGGDPEDKEMLNALILLIENFHHLSSELSLDSGLMRNTVLAACHTKAYTALQTNKSRYVSAVIRRPLGRLLDFLEGIEESRDGMGGRVGMPTYSKSALKKVLGAHDAKTTKRDVEALRKRVEKHFTPDVSTLSGSGAGISEEGMANQKLISEVLEECQVQWERVQERAERVAREVFEGEVEVGFSKGDVGGAFRR